VVYDGALEIVADEPIALAGFRLEGDGWQPQAVVAPASVDLAKSARLEVRFSALPDDADKPLVVVFERADGRCAMRSTSPSDTTRG